MPNILRFFNVVRSWRVDIGDVVDNKGSKPATPVINLATSIEQPEKKSLEGKPEGNENETPVDQNRGWLSTHLQRLWNFSLRSASGEMSEMQNMLPSVVVHKDKEKESNNEEKEHTICLIAESPYRILKAAESGNLETFQRLYFADPSRLVIRDPRGRTAAHQAAFKNRTNILQFITAHGGDLNMQDNLGNTPLHVAVEAEALDAVDYLLQLEANTSILNEKKQAVIHLVTELNKVGVLEIMMSRHKDKIDIQQGGEHGRTALHLAAIYDHDECARILTQFGACPRQPCNNGYYPIHEAAKNASSKTLEVFLQWGESNGCSREEMISFYDAEGNVPLHSAVHGGDLKAVELCIKSGAKISMQQHDLSTPVHLACSQGATEIVKVMFKLQPDEKFQCLQSCDVQKMTPLHCAAMFDHPDIVEYLIGEGAEINAADKEKRSPLLLAASRGGWKTVHTLIRLGADINVKDINRRNVLHLVVMNGGRLEQFANEVNKSKCQSNLLQLLNEKDNTGCSPLHYASREGHIRSLENLIRLGAVINLKNNNNESPLHFAARYGRYNTLKQLLDSEKGTFIINESDGEGMTPLHISSQQGHTRIVQLLLNRGALLHRDHNGRTPLHLAAMNGYTLTIELLLSVHSHLLDQTDKDGNTALHLATMDSKPTVIALLLSMKCKLLYNKHGMSAVDYAIHYKYPEAALAMVTHEGRSTEILALKSDKHPCVTLALIAAMPRVFEAVQDKCIIKASCKKDSKSFYIQYNFACLECPDFYANMDGKTGEALSISKPIPLPALNAMVSHGRVELLAHPLSQKYLQMKWNSYGKYFHIANLLFYSIFLSFVTCFTSQLMAHEHPPVDFYRQFYKPGGHHFSQSSTWKEKMNKTYDEYLADSKTDILKVTVTPVMYINAMGIMVYIGLNSVREIIQLYQQKLLYFMDPTNLVSWLLYISASIMVFPLFGGTIAEMQFSFGSVTIFLSWLNLLLLLQRFDQVGIYVVMFLEILQTLIKVLMVFSILIIAFGLAFYILLSRGEHLSFRTIPMSLIRTFSMMLGEIDFLGTFVEPFYLRKEDGRTLPFPIPAFLILGVFMVLMPILLMNLLIGLAVGDIESVRRNAQLKRLAMQVILHTELESKLPKILMEKIDKSELIEFPNDTKCKLGFLDSIIRRFGNPFSDDGVDMMMESNEDFIANEIEKTKKKLRDISSTLETQQQLLRLIVQKMEIKTEDDDVDEGVSPNESNHSAGGNRWTSPKIRKKLRTALNFSKPSP